MIRKTGMRIIGAIIALLLACGIGAYAKGPVRTAARPLKPILVMTPDDLFRDSGAKHLAQAAQLGRTAEINALIAKGVNVNARGKFGVTPLLSAWQSDNRAGFAALLDHGANPNVIWRTGDSMMNVIASSRDSDLLKLALKHGGNPNLVAPNSGETPLLAAIVASLSNGNANIPLLIKAGANLNYRTPDSRRTPLMVAVTLGQFDAAEELLRAGADYRIKNGYGQDIRDSIIACSTHNMPKAQLKARRQVVDFLKRHNFWIRIAPPTDLNVNSFSVNTGSFVVFSWNTVAKATSYDISVNGNVYQTGIHTTKTKIKASIRDVNSTGNIGLRVRACDHKGCSPWSNVMGVRVTE